MSTFNRDRAESIDLILKRIAELEATNLKHGKAWADLDRFLGPHRHADRMTLQEAIKLHITELYENGQESVLRIAELERERDEARTERDAWKQAMQLLTDHNETMGDLP